MKLKELYYGISRRKRMTGSDDMTIQLSTELRDRYDVLRSTLKEMGSIVIGFSGGVDSTLLLKVAHDVLGPGALAVIGKSETYPTREYEEAVSLAGEIGARYMVVNTEETDILKFRENPSDRCYFCKTELFGKLKEIAVRENIAWIADGTNLDDTGDFRPGMAAKKEKDVRSPLLEARLTKQDIRILSKYLSLRTWDKQSFACLSSRFPYGQSIDKPKLTKIDTAENILRDSGFRYFRARHHDDKTVRIEVGQEEIGRFFDNDFRQRIVSEMKKIGFVYITLDLMGFRSGSMNEVLSDEEKQKYSA
jgi:pyridinium-3,5-biscarboxylic acid mononucleotide sulfurtransferase